MALFFLGVMAVAAYAYTPSIKVGGKVYALTVQDSRPDADESSGQHRCRRGCPEARSRYRRVQRNHLRDEDVVAPRAAPSYLIRRYLCVCDGRRRGLGRSHRHSFLVFLAVATGYGDASWRYGIARGQHIYFGLAAVVTVGVFAVLCASNPWSSVPTRDTLKTTKSSVAAAGSAWRRSSSATF